MSIPVFGGLIVKEGNTYKKVPVPVTEQRDSSERWLPDIWRTYFLQKDSNGRYRGYKSIVANEGNIIFIPKNLLMIVLATQLKRGNHYKQMEILC